MLTLSKDSVLIVYVTIGHRKLFINGEAPS